MRAGEKRSSILKGALVSEESSVLPSIFLEREVKTEEENMYKMGEERQ